VFPCMRHDALRGALVCVPLPKLRFILQSRVSFFRVETQITQVFAE
jgi:hypothetical protein